MEDYILTTDISHHQGENIDFNKMRAMNVRVCHMKRSEGNYFTDQRFDWNWKACQDADIIPDPYHFVVPWDAYKKKPITGKENADYFMSKLEGYDPILPLIGDVEKGMSNTPDLVTTVVQSFYQTIGYPNINYTADWFWSYRVKPWSGWKNSLLWVMSIPYYNSAEKTHYPNHELFLKYLSEGSKFPIMPRATDGKPSWDDWMIWQFSHQGKGKDYGLARTQPIDLNIAKPALLNGVIPPPPPPPEEYDPMEDVKVIYNEKSYVLVEE